MAIKGKRAVAPRWEAGMRCGVDGEAGEIMRINDEVAMVMIDSPNAKVNPIKRVPIGELTKAPKRCDSHGCKNYCRPGMNHCAECTMPGTDASPIDNFSQYAIKWSANNTHFRFKIADQELKFYGWWRKTRIVKSDEIIYAIDIYAIREEKEYQVDSITYTEDPRIRVRMLNADICAACSRWLSTKLNSNSQTIDQLRTKAEHPSIHCKRIESIDRIILKLREVRDTAIRCGGSRLCEIRGDGDQPPMIITIDVSSQAYALEGRVPPLDTASLYDATLGGSEGGTRRLVNKPSPENVAALQAKLRETKDKGEGRKIRAMLRKMGHRGGGRAKLETVPQAAPAKAVAEGK